MKPRSLLFMLLLAAGCPAAGGLSEDDVGESVSEEDPREIFEKTYGQEMTDITRYIFEKKKYNMHLRPVRNQSLPVNIGLHLHFVHLAVDEEKGTVTASGHLYMAWVDENAGWPTEKFGRIRTAQSNRFQIWTPNIRILNSIAGVGDFGDINRIAHVILTASRNETARIESYPTFTISVECDFDFSTFPYDEHNCVLMFYTQAPMSQINLRIYNDLEPTIILSWPNANKSDQPESKKVVSNFFIESITNNVSYASALRPEDVSIANMPMNDEEFERTWSIVTCYIRLRRHAPTYGVVITLPLFVLCMLTALSLAIKDALFAFYVNLGIIPLGVIFMHDLLGQLPSHVSRVPTAVFFYGILMVTNIVIAAVHALLAGIRMQERRRVFVHGYVTAITAWMPAPERERQLIQEAAAAGELQEWDMAVNFLRLRAAAAVSAMFAAIMIYSYFF